MVGSLILSRLVSPIGGVVSHVRPYDDGSPNDARAHVVQIASAGHGPRPEHAPTLTGVGVGADNDAATDDAIRRALALYAAAMWSAPEMRWASADELGDDAIPVEDLARLLPIETRDRIRWVEGFALEDGRPMWIPAVLVHVGLPVAVEAENFWPASLAGLSVANGLGDAVIGGLLDVIARDALAIARTRGTRLALLRRDADGIAVFDATTDVGIPAAIAQGPASFEVGLGAATTTSGAVAAAVFDLARRRAERAFATYPEEPPPDPGFEPIGEGAVSAAGDAAPIDLSKPALVARLRKVGLSGFAVDLTTSEAESVGLNAVRVVVPGLSPIPPTVGWADHARLARAAG